MRGRTQSAEGEIIGKPLPGKIFDATFLKMIYKYKNNAEMHGCRKTSVLKNEAKVPDYFMFSDFCNNFPEVILYARAGKFYKTRFIEKTVRTYHFDAPETYMKSNEGDRSIKKTYNTLVQAKYMIEENRQFLIKWEPKTYFKYMAAILYTSFCLKRNAFKIIEKPTFFEKVFLILSYLPIWVAFKIRG